MNRTGLALYTVHGVFWLSFLLGRWLNRSAKSPDAGAEALVTEAPITAAHSRSLLVLHTLAFSVMYAGIGAVAFKPETARPITGYAIPGAIVVLLGAALSTWALLSFRSWRFRARLDAGHQLATEGAFSLVRHPIYTAMMLLALGTLLWIPDMISLVGAGLMIVGCDLRARSEEKILLKAFGESYRQYMEKTPRFLPRL